MMTLRRLDDRLLDDVNDFARHTGWLHGAILGYATYGLLLFAGLMLAALLLHRTGSDRDLAAAGWSALATLIAVGLNQPLVAAFAEPRPYTAHPHLLVLASRSTRRLVPERPRRDGRRRRSRALARLPPPRRDRRRRRPWRWPSPGSTSPPTTRGTSWPDSRSGRSWRSSAGSSSGGR